MDKSAFLAWVQTRERQRCELVNGSVVEAPPNTLAHALITGNLARVLEAALGRKQWQILLSFGVDTGPRTIRDPDILVDSGGNPADLTANAPVFLAEVLSPTSGTIDLGDKPGVCRTSSLILWCPKIRRRVGSGCAAMLVSRLHRV